MKGCLPNIMGANASAALMKEIGRDQFPPNERYFGLHNFGNTCYCNSILQALFFCPPFRDRVLQYRNEQNGLNDKKDSLLGCLCDLFYSIANNKKKCGVLQPKKFVARLRKENESFDNYMQHDAHELFNHLLNSIHVVLLEEKKTERERKMLQEQELSNAGSYVKKERASFFSRNKKSKELNSLSSKVGASSFVLNENIQDVPESSADSSAGVEDLSHTSGNDQSHESLSSSESPKPVIEGKMINLTDLLNGREQTENKPAVNNARSPSKSSGVSFLSRLRYTKKGSSASSRKSEEDDSSESVRTQSRQSELDAEDSNTWINDLFQGTYTTITRCLNCETVKNKDEDFLDLSVDIEQNTSITHCLRVFSNQQMLSGEHKYSCEVCRSKQEAQIQMRIKKLPTILALHLKRFKYCDTLNKYTKLTYRVVFPFELRLFNTTDDAANPERLYDLMAVVVHCGSGPYRGHYVSIVKSHNMWLLFDDDNVEKLEASGMEDFYGVTADKNSESGYILFYQAKDQL